MAVTHLGDGGLPPRRPGRGMPRWLVFAITVLAFSVPIAGLLMLVWPALVRQTNAITDEELIYLAVAAILIGGALASYIHVKPPAHL